MDSHPETDSANDTDEALCVSLRVWHPDCWVIELTERLDIGLIGYGTRTRPSGRTTTLYTLYANTEEQVSAAIEEIHDHPQVYAVSEVNQTHRLDSTSTPGNATKGLLIDHDGTTQISDEFLSRGFVHAEPVDGNDGVEYWTLLTNEGRSEVKATLDEICESAGADITVLSITEATWGTGLGGLPLHRLTRRQHEVFRLAREEGYYSTPRGISAEALATELGISKSTLNEHLHKVEAKLLGVPERGD
ncbi:MULTISPECIES: helix-turn-helix domain-containing protein [Halorussus]|uniref:helix-turn-helix domain-containing protein n=1 Tax=Halorussus TaxID=1070314 RepID=UPI00209CC655|nr:helix-turn-helix domain-containing protein [Halorussus vallis]USZ74126.1 helix-turn-helix domain-containing protein [Halorussus vallis]